MVISFITILFLISSPYNINYSLSKVPDEPQTLIKISQNSKVGLKNTDGIIVVSPIYQDLGINQINGMLAVKRENKWGFVNKNFIEVIKPIFDEVGYFYCGWCPVRIGNLWGLIDLNGQWVVNPMYDYIEISKETKTAIIIKNGKYGLIDDRGNIRINTEYENLTFIKDGMLSFLKNRKTGMVNQLGVEIFPAEYTGIYGITTFPEKSKYMFSVLLEKEVPTKSGSSLERETGFFEKSGKTIIMKSYEGYDFITEDLAIVYDEFGNVGLADLNANHLFKPSKCEIKPYLSDKFIIVKYNRYHGIINNSGQVIVKPIYTFMAKVGENLLVCSGNLKGGKWGIIDKNGKTIVPLKYSNAKTNGKYVCFEDNGLWGILDATGKITAKPQFSYEPNFIENDLIRVFSNKNDHLYVGYTNIYGESLTKSLFKSKFPFEEAMPFNQGLASVKMKGMWGFIDASGKIVIPCKYNLCSDFQNGVAWVEEVIDNVPKYGLINKNGDYLLEPQFKAPLSSLIIGIY